MFKLQRTANGEVVFAVIGRLEADNLSELSVHLAREPPGRALALDLKDLILADRDAVTFLKECEAQGIALRNCPGYIRVWIASGTERP